MHPRTLRLLERLARREAEQVQRELAAVETQRREVEAALAGERTARPFELAVARELAAGTRVASGFWLGTRHRETALDRARTALATRADELRQTLSDGLATQRRYASCAEAMERRHHTEQAKRELAVIEEADHARRRAATRR